MQPLAQRLRIVGQVVIGDALKAALAQRGDHGIGVGPPDLMRRNRIAGLHQLVARGDDDNCGLAADAHACHAG